ncbi:MAG: conjugative transposon protein TraM [Bacteroidota bacterium]
METNSTINYGDNPNLLSGKNKKFVPVVIAVFGFFLFGLTFYGFGIFDKKEEKTKKEESIINVEKSKQKDLEEKKLDFSQNRKIEIKSESAAQNYKAIYGEDPKEKLNGNENLRLSDFEEVKKADWNETPVTKKDRVNRKAQAQIELANRQNKNLMRNDTYLYRQTKAEEEEARREAVDRQTNERTQNLILEQLEKANANQSKTTYQSQISSEELPKNEKETPKTRRAKTPPSGAGGLLIAPVIGKNTTAQFWAKETVFYNLNAKVSQQSYSENRGIMAVVHGDAENISVINGQELKIRLLEPLRIIERGENIILPIGTLISTKAKIGSDRLYLNIEGLFWENQLRTVNISVFDIDGREGLNVPALLNNQNANRLVNNLSNPISGGQYFMPTGTVGQQVGSSIAMNLAQNALQTGSQYLRKRSRVQKIEIRINYKIILFNSKSNRNENTTTEEAILED